MSELCTPGFSAPSRAPSARSAAQSHQHPCWPMPSSIRPWCRRSSPVASRCPSRSASCVAAACSRVPQPGRVGDHPRGFVLSFALAHRELAGHCFKTRLRAAHAPGVVARLLVVEDVDPDVAADSCGAGALVCDGIVAGEQAVGVVSVSGFRPGLHRIGRRKRRSPCPAAHPWNAANTLDFALEMNPPVRCRTAAALPALTISRVSVHRDAASSQSGTPI